jgi:hypothetical protein
MPPLQRPEKKLPREGQLNAYAGPVERQNLYLTPTLYRVPSWVANSG